jgi:hypothetical protein
MLVVGAARYRSDLFIFPVIPVQVVDDRSQNTCAALRFGVTTPPGCASALHVGAAMQDRARPMGGTGTASQAGAV